jgi:hypothetical protein
VRLDLSDEASPPHREPRASTGPPPSVRLLKSASPPADRQRTTFTQALPTTVDRQRGGDASYCSEIVSLRFARYTVLSPVDCSFQLLTHGGSLACAVHMPSANCNSCRAQSMKRTIDREVAPCLIGLVVVARTTLVAINSCIAAAGGAHGQLID